MGVVIGVSLIDDGFLPSLAASNPSKLEKHRLERKKDGRVVSPRSPLLVSPTLSCLLTKPQRCGQSLSLPQTICNHPALCFKGVAEERSISERPKMNRHLESGSFPRRVGMNGDQ